jgi:uncharacterized protein YuzE
MKTERQHFIIKGAPATTVEVDTQVNAVYVRFKKTSVARTVAQPCAMMHVAVDLDSRGEVIGIEAVGIKEFSLSFVLQKASVKAPDLDFSRTRYIPADLVGV